MGHGFESDDRIEVDATPEQVWAAIATGPGHDSWFMGANVVEPGVGGQVSSDFAGGAIPAATVTAWEPGRHLGYRASGPDGRFLASEYLIEARDGGGAVLRVVTSGFLPGDDWQGEYEAMRAGSCLFRSTLACYLDHFAGRVARPLTVFGPTVTDWAGAWKQLDDALGLGGLDRDTPVRFTLGGRSVEGVLYGANEQVRGIRTPQAMYRFVQAFDPHGTGSPMLAMHHVFDPTLDPGEAAWNAWLTDVLS
ncbi:SRPBCC domain-containing protein [Spongisporangium articulatum]|uniref:SRPBCC domain-containing protein n=1 Tax=Spongisporangium articulatum TaxID=3362603 RepID=A0ABW8APH0_9ACTN